MADFSSNVDLTRSDTRWDGTVGLDQKMAAYCGFGEACAGTSFFSSKKMSTYRFLFFFIMSDTREKKRFFPLNFKLNSNWTTRITVFTYLGHCEVRGRKTLANRRDSNHLDNNSVNHKRSWKSWVCLSSLSWNSVLFVPQSSVSV